MTSSNRYGVTMMLAFVGLLLLGCLSCTEAKGEVKKGDKAAASTVIQLREMRHTQQELRAAMKRLTESERLMKAALATIEVRSKATEQEVQLLQKQNKVKQVAFSASLRASGGGHTGPFNAQTILIYRHVISNVGKRYNPNTGVFTAPVKGVYQFSFFLYGGGAAHPTAAVLVKNGQPVVIAYEHQRTHGVNPSNGASLLLEAGDVVFVKLWQNAWIFDNGNHHSTFSGHLLFTV